MRKPRSQAFNVAYHKEANYIPLLFAIGVGSILALISVLVIIKNSEPVHINQLALGKDSRVANKLTIPTYRSIEFDGLTKEQILEIRTEAVKTHRELVKGAYIPSKHVFGRIEDGLPWYGMYGHYVAQRGPLAPEGLSLESKYILNPFNILAVEFWGLTTWGTYGVEWKQDPGVQSDLKSSSFPFYPSPRSITWFPRAKRVRIEYDIRAHIQKLRHYTVKDIQDSFSEFGLSTVNAADFGYRYIFLDNASSKNIRSKYNPGKPLPLGDYYAQTYRCRYPGGCNQREHMTTHYDYIRATALPAYAVFKLWKDKPDVDGSGNHRGLKNPDLEVLLNLK